MTQKIINTGTADKGNGDPIRTAFTKVNENFTELYNSVSAVVVTGATAPTSPGVGDLWWDSESGRMYVYYGTSWVDASPVDGAGINSTNELVNGNKTVSLASTGIITLPSSSYLESTDTNLKVGAQGTVTIRSNAESNTTTRSWTFGRQGTLTVPSMFPTMFTATVDAAHYYGEGSLTLSGSAWSFEVTFAIGANGATETQIANSTPWPSNPGYTNGIAFRFVEADHGIPGYTFTLTLVDIQNPGPMMHTTNLTASTAPTLPAAIISSETVKITADATSWLFTPNGSFTVPAVTGEQLTISGSEIFGVNTSSVAVSSNDKVVVNTYSPALHSWQFDNVGTLTVPTPSSAGPFTLAFASTNYVATGPKPTLTLATTPWELEGQYVYAPDGRSQLVLNDPFPYSVNPGYESGDAFTFDVSVHGIPEFTLTITLNDIQEVDTAVWTATIVASEAPVYTSTILANGAIKLTNNTDSSWIFGTDGKLTFPNGSTYGASTLVGAKDEDLTFTVGYRPTVSVVAASGSTTGRLKVDITSNDDITAIETGNDVWEFNTGTEQDPIWKNVTSEYILFGIEFDVLVTGYEFVEGETYTFRNTTATLNSWHINNNTGTLIAPGGAILSSETSIIGEGDAYRDFSIELATPNGNNEYRWLFANDTGAFTVPGPINATFGTGALDFDSGSLGTSIVRLSTTDTIEITDLILHPTLGISLTTNRNVAISAGAGQTELYNNWFVAEIQYEQARLEDIGSIFPDTRPWADMPSYEAFDVIAAYVEPNGVLPVPGSFPPVVYAAKLAYEAWQAELAAINVTIDVADKDWVFGQDGALTVPGIITKDDILQLVSSGTSTSAAFQVDGSNTRLLLRTNNGSSNSDLTFDINGTLTLPNYNPVENAPNIKIGTSTRIVDTNSGIDIPVGTPGGTVYTSSFTDLASMKLLVTIEGEEDTGDGWPHTQVCEMMVVRRDAAGIITVNSSVYGVVYTGNGPLATLTAITSTDGRVDIIAEATNEENITVKVHAIEIFRNQ